MVYEIFGITFLAVVFHLVKTHFSLRFSSIFYLAILSIIKRDQGLHSVSHFSREFHTIIWVVCFTLWLHFLLILPFWNKKKHFWQSYRCHKGLYHLLDLCKKTVGGCKSSLPFDSKENLLHFSSVSRSRRTFLPIYG